jgi:hypothetical protein
MHRIRKAPIRSGGRRISGFEWMLGAGAAFAITCLWLWHARYPENPSDCEDAAILDRMAALSRTLMQTVISGNVAHHDAERIAFVYPDGRFRIAISGVQETMSLGAERVCRASVGLTTPNGFKALRNIEYRIVQNENSAKEFFWLRAQDDVGDLNLAVMGPFCKSVAVP